MTPNIPDQILEQYRLRELPPRRLAELDLQIQRDPALQARLARLQHSDREILETYPPSRMAEKIRQRFQPASVPAAQGRVRPWVWGAPALAAACAALALWAGVPHGPDFFRSQAWEVTRSKGAQTELFVFRKTASGAELLKNFSRAKKGDLLQIAYVAPKNTYGVILSVDGRGTVTLHWPARAQTLSPRSAGQKSVLPAAYELDDAPGFEKFFLITSEHAFAPQLALDSARAWVQNPGRVKTESLPLPAGLRQSTLLIEKGE